MTPPPAQVEEERDEEASNEIIEESEFGPLLISKLEVTITIDWFVHCINPLHSYPLYILCTPLNF